MKSLRALLCFILPFLFFTGCGGSSPLEQSVEQFYRAVADGETAQAVAMFDEASFSKTQSEDRNKLVTMLVREMATRMNQHGGLKNVKVRDAQMLEDGKRAQLSAVLGFNDGTIMRDQLNMVLTDQGWKIDLQ